MAALLTQALHAALVLVAALLLPGVVVWLRARAMGTCAARPSLRPWFALARRRAVPVLGAGPSAGVAPALAAGAAWLAAMLVPGFAGGMALAPLSDLLLVGGLLALAEALRCAALLDDASASAGVAAGRILALAPLVVPGFLLLAGGLAGLGVAGLGGGGHLDALLAALRETSPGLAWLLLLAALLVLVLCAAGAPPVALDPTLPESAGRDLALWQLHAGLRLVAMAGLLAALAWPWSIAPAGWAPLAWALGLLAWAAKLGLVALLLALAGLLLPRGGLRAAPGWFGAAMLCGALAAALLFIAAGPA